MVEFFMPNERKAFDDMMNKARAHSSAASFDVHPDPIEPIIMSILLEQEKEINELKKMRKNENVSPQTIL